jgi:hypothetical protein
MSCGWTEPKSGCQYFVFLGKRKLYGTNIFDFIDRVSGRLKDAGSHDVGKEAIMLMLVIVRKGKCARFPCFIRTVEVVCHVK